MRVLLLLLLLYLFYRFIRFFFLLPRRFLRGTPPSSGPTQARPVLDEMKACAACGTFVPSKMAVQEKGLYFCDGDCLRRSHQQ